MAESVTLTPDQLQGSVRVSASGLPAGDVVITRTSAREAPTIIRAGEFHQEAGGFIRQDTDPPYGIPVEYRVTLSDITRLIQSNRVLNPKAKYDANNWTAPTARTMTRETAADLAPIRDATTSLRVGSNTGGVVTGSLNDRLLASTQPSGFGPGRWFVSGQMRFDNEDLWLWQDVKDAGTWQTVKNKGTWQQVRSSSSEAAGEAFTSLWAGVVSPGTTITEDRRNYVVNPSFEVDTAGWNVHNSTIARSTAQALFGTSSLLINLTTGNPVVTGAATTLTGLTVGTHYTVSAYVYVPSGSEAARMALFITGGVAVSQTVTAPGVWTRINCDFTATATSHDLLIANGNAALAGMTAYIDGVLVEASPSATPGTYFDGSTAASGLYTYAWAGTAHASASIRRVNDVAVVSAPFQVLGVTSTSGNTWLTFSAWITVPANAPANARLAFFQGTQVREYANVWWLSTILVTPESEMTAGALNYFDGDTPLPANPAANRAPVGNWQPIAADASITWNGTDNASVSIFTGPSAITTSATTTLLPPERSTLGGVKAPLQLSDPVVPQMHAWFELLAIGELSFKERADLYDVLGRGPQIAVSQVRAWASGQLSLMTRTLTEIRLVERMFGSGRILLMRNPDPRYPETDWYLHIGEVRQARVGSDYARPERAWTVPFVRVERPVGLIEGAVSTSWAQVKASGKTWADLRAQRKDWLDVALEDAS